MIKTSDTKSCKQHLRDTKTTKEEVKRKRRWQQGSEAAMSVQATPNEELKEEIQQCAKKTRSISEYVKRLTVTSGESYNGAIHSEGRNVAKNPVSSANKRAVQIVGQ